MASSSRALATGAVLLLALALELTTAAVIPIRWSVGLDTIPPNVRNAKCGDTVNFRWVGNHDLVRTTYGAAGGAQRSA